MFMDQEQAEILALEVFSFLAENEDGLIAYMRLSGLRPEDLKNNISNPEILSGVLDFLLQDEKRLVLFCENHQYDPNIIQKARHSLPGAFPQY